MWKHLLNVYPENMTARERIDYVKTKSAEYRELRDCWMKLVQDGMVRGVGPRLQRVQEARKQGGGGPRPSDGDSHGTVWLRPGKMEKSRLC